MFTGIIAAVGVVRDAKAVEGGRVVRVGADFADLALGESIAIDGACLTATGHGDGWFEVHVVTTSLGRTGFANYRGGRRVNLERALRAGDRLGGHLVQGHVDDVGRVLSVAAVDDATVIDIQVPAAVMAVSIPLGSIAVDGVSLTVNAIPAPDLIQVSVIPFTLEHTTLGDRVVGDLVHLEGDLVGKYVTRLAEGWRAVAAR
ncbi:MAG TPA: riboflavin synthase [Gemmatimonadales bacterium]